MEEEEEGGLFMRTNYSRAFFARGEKRAGFFFFFLKNHSQGLAEEMADVREGKIRGKFP